ncbi:MAG: tetratricopeptide repeat protein [Kofleriaceae bacterium]
MEDAHQALRAAIDEICRAPRDPDPRRDLRALVAEQDSWEPAAALLASHATAAEDPEVAAALYAQLADVYEDLDNPLEAVAAMEQVVELEPDDVDHVDRLAWLYHRVGAWARAGEMFERVASLAFDVQARAALRAAGQLYRDNSQHDRAAIVYRQLIERRPGDRTAWQALEEVLTQLERWHEVAEVRGELVARTPGAVEQAALLRAQARAFEQAGEPSRALALISRAVALAPSDDSAVVDYAQVLAREGRGREAADLVARRIAEAREAGSETDALAALRLRMVGVLDDACHDRMAARALLDELLAAAPEYVPALVRLVQFTATDPDPRARPEALLRQAAALYDIDKAAVLVEASRLFRALGDHGPAARALERATELVPDEDLRRELAEIRAAIDVTRAGDEARGGEPVEAERRLRAVLASQPHHVEANLALAVLLSTTDRMAAASAHLTDALVASRPVLAPEPLARLVGRLASVRAALGADDHAHELLHEAHHLDRRSLTITLALGQSCFARRLWREAALHLGSLAGHPEAGGHREAVAAGLVHAGLAETRALRPANALRHFQAAVALDAGCARAWHALAEAAMEHDDVARAAECLAQQAAATTEPRERLRLFDALGDLMRDVLHDDGGAEQCWLAVADTAPAPLLDKLLAVQRLRPPDVARARTCERLAEQTMDPSARKQLLDEAIGAYQDGGELARARELVGRLLAEHPLDEVAVTRGSSIAIATGDHEAAAAWLRRALGAWDAASDRGAGDADRAELWRRLGDVEAVRGNPQAAVVAYERAVATSPASAGALGARRALVDVAIGDGRDAGDMLFELVEADPRPREVLALARELARTSPDDARAMFELATALGASLEPTDDETLAAHPARSIAADEAYGAPLADADREALVRDPDDAPIAELLELYAEASALVLPDARTALDRVGLAEATRLGASRSIAAAMYPQIANALHGAPTLLYTTTRATELTLILAHPPVVVLGSRLAHTSEIDQRFVLGRVVELTRPRRLLTSDPDSFMKLLGALGHAFGNAPDPQFAGDAARLHDQLPMLLRRRIAEYLAARELAAPLDAAAYVEACQRAADRAGLLACGRTDAAIARAGGPTRAPHLVRVAASRRYLAVRRMLRPRRVR